MPLDLGLHHWLPMHPINNMPATPLAKLHAARLRAQRQIAKLEPQLEDYRTKLADIEAKIMKLNRLPSSTRRSTVQARPDAAHGAGTDESRRHDHANSPCGSIPRTKGEAALTRLAAQGARSIPPPLARESKYGNGHLIFAGDHIESGPLPMLIFVGDDTGLFREVR